MYRPTLHDVGAILFVKCEKSKLVSVALVGRPATPTKMVNAGVPLGCGSYGLTSRILDTLRVFPIGKEA